MYNTGSLRHVHPGPSANPANDVPELRPNPSGVQGVGGSLQPNDPLSNPSGVGGSLLNPPNSSPASSAAVAAVNTATGTGTGPGRALAARPFLPKAGGGDKESGGASTACHSANGSGLWPRHSTRRRNRMVRAAAVAACVLGGRARAYVYGCVMCTLRIRWVGSGRGGILTLSGTTADRLPWSRERGSRAGARAART